METLVQNLPAWMAQTVLLASAGAVLPIVFRLRHPRTQLAYCHVVLAACLLLPWIEPWRNPGLLAPAAGSAEADVSRVESHSTASPLPAEVHPGRAMQPPLPASPVPGPRPSRWTEYASRRFLPWVFAAGVLARLSWLLGGLWQIRRYRMAAMPLYPIPESVRAASAVTHADALFCISSHTPGPVMLGWLAPVVLLPESFLKLEDEGQCGIACHELLHAQRSDWLLTVLEEAAGALLWFNPSAWLLLAQTRLAREQLVDAEAVRFTASREPYIEALLAIARGRSTSDLAPSPAFLQRRHLTHRMQSLLKEVSVSRLRLLTSYGSIAATLVLTGWFAVASFPLMGRPVIKLASDRTVTDTPVVPVSPHGQEPGAVAAQIRPGPAAPTSTGTEDISSPVALGARRPITMAFQARRGPAGGAFVQTDDDSVPVPPDPHEPIIGAIQIPATPADHAAALSLLERARQNSNMHIQGTPPFCLRASFVASGNVTYAGPGELTETWLSGQRWRWTASLGNYSQVRIGSSNVGYDETPVRAVPMWVHLLRNAIFWPVPQVSGAGLRTASIQWNRKPATCLLVSGMPATVTSTRMWEEQEYCMDDASGLLQVYSMAPGTYLVYGYGRSTDFHGRLIPDQITVYLGGVTALEAQPTIVDAGSVAQSSLSPTPEMTARGLGIALQMPTRLRLDVPSPLVSGKARPVMVLAEIDGEGHVMEAEMSAASDPSLAQAALDLVKNRAFPVAWATQREVYVNVRFVPASQ